MKRIPVDLSPSEFEELKKKVSSGTSPAREIQHARVLLGSSQGHPDTQVAREAGVSEKTVWRVRRLFAEEGLQAALARKAQPPRPNARKVTDETEARLLALAQSQAPEGRSRWTLRLLADRVVELGYSLSHESVRQALKRGACDLGASSNG